MKRARPGFPLPLAATVLLLLSVAQVRAQTAQPHDEFLCGPLLPCLSAPGGASAHPECKSALTVIFERLRAGQGFPSCPQSGIKVSPEGYSPYMDCDRGYRAVETESRVVVCRGVAPDGRVIAITAKARANPQYVDITFLNGFNVRLWYSRGS
jgi:hypothetical protein